MKILVLNCGSSSIKYQLINMEDEAILTKGVVERIGIDDSLLEHQKDNGEEIIIKEKIEDHAQGIKLVINTILNKDYGVLQDSNEIDAIGHRVLHGGEKFTESILINDEVEKAIEDNCELGPLHNPHNLTGIRVCKDLMPDKPQVAVFDTAFHQTMPKKAFIYALPYEYYEKYGIRRYGFHGTSHLYVANRAAELMGKPIEELKIISCHLGNGASITAVDGGKSIDTSMGLTPLEGLVMGTRCGDIDPAIIPFIMDKENLTMGEVDNIMNTESGLCGVSGVSSDSRDVEAAASSGNERAKTALEIFDYRVIKYVGAYIAAMGGVDSIVFTAGIGENQSRTRAGIIKNLAYLDIYLNEEANKLKSEEVEITTSESRVKVFVIPTNEELVIARDTAKIIQV
ncbi:MAG TPA: acetate kinase [Halanaerobiales bacterium]|nr:acetate kinase [Halanaerobiales bacterium]